MSLKEFDDLLRIKYNAKHLIGSDEAGRGAWAGPIVGAAVCFDESFDHNGIRDSKSIVEHVQRIKLAQIIKTKAIFWRIEIYDADQIDKNGLTAANKFVIENPCLAAEKQLGESVLFVVDQSPASCLKPMAMMPRADAQSLAVAAASILAKTTRDNIMIALHDVYPQFNFQNHKGYVNEEHIEEVKKYGKIHKIHRMSYKVSALKESLTQQFNIFDV